jgi:hypothetical protein
VGKSRPAVSEDAGGFALRISTSGCGARNAGAILEAFKEHNNPLEAVAESIVSSQESYLKRSDAQKRRRVLEELNVVLNEMPEAQTLAVTF